MTTEQQKMLNNIRQTDAIMALEGFQPDDDMRVIQNAMLMGHITPKQAADELRDYVYLHKTTRGFVQSREWIK